MSDLRPNGTPIILGQTKQADGTFTPNEYGLRFTLNAIEKIQDNFNISIKQLGELFKDERNAIKNLKYILTVLINEDIDCVNDEEGTNRPQITEAFVGRHIDATNFSLMKEQVFRSVGSGTPKPAVDDDAPEENGEELDPNASSGQRTR